MKTITPQTAKKIRDRKRARAREYYRRNAERINRKRRLQYKKVTTLADAGAALEKVADEHDDQ